MDPRRLLLLLLLAGPLPARADAVGDVYRRAWSWVPQWLGQAGRMVAPLREIRFDVTPEIALAGYVAGPPTYRLHKQDALRRPDEERESAGKLQVLRMDVSLGEARAASWAQRQDWAVGIEGRFRPVGVATSGVDLGATIYASLAWGPL